MNQLSGAPVRSSVHSITPPHPPSTQASPPPLESKSGRRPTPAEPGGPAKGLTHYVISEGSPGAAMLRHASLVHGKLNSLCETLGRDPTQDAGPHFESLVTTLGGPTIKAFDLDVVLRHLFNPSHKLSVAQLGQALQGTCRALGGTAMSPAHRLALFERGVTACDAMPGESAAQATHMVRRLHTLVSTLFTDAVAPAQHRAFARELYHRIAKPDAQLSSDTTLATWRHILRMLHPGSATLEAVLSTVSEFAQKQESFNAGFAWASFVPVTDRIREHVSGPANTAKWVRSAMDVLLFQTKWPESDDLCQAMSGFATGLIDAPRIVHALGALLDRAPDLGGQLLHTLVACVSACVWTSLPDIRRQVLQGAFERLTAPGVPIDQALTVLSGMLVGARHLVDVPMVAARITAVAKRIGTTREFMTEAGVAWRLSWAGQPQEAQALAAMKAEIKAALPEAGDLYGRALTAFERGLELGAMPKAQASEPKADAKASGPAPTEKPLMDGLWGAKRNG